jgi:hypothetical protein
MNKFPSKINNFNNNQKPNLIDNKNKEKEAVNVNNANKNVNNGNNPSINDKQTQNNKSYNFKVENIEMKKPEKIKKQRLKLDEKNLFYSENGVKKLYDVAIKTEFKPHVSDVIYILTIRLLI